MAVEKLSHWQDGSREKHTENLERVLLQTLVDIAEAGISELDRADRRESVCQTDEFARDVESTTLKLQVKLLRKSCLDMEIVKKAVSRAGDYAKYSFKWHKQNRVLGHVGEAACNFTERSIADIKQTAADMQGVKIDNEEDAVALESGLKDIIRQIGVSALKLDIVAELADKDSAYGELSFLKDCCDTVEMVVELVGKEVFQVSLDQVGHNAKLLGSLFAMVPVWWNLVDFGTALDQIGTVEGQEAFDALNAAVHELHLQRSKDSSKWPSEMRERFTAVENYFECAEKEVMIVLREFGEAEVAQHRFDLEHALTTLEQISKGGKNGESWAANMNADETWLKTERAFGRTTLAQKGFMPKLVKQTDEMKEMEADAIDCCRKHGKEFDSGMEERLQNVYDEVTVTLVEGALKQLACDKTLSKQSRDDAIQVQLDVLTDADIPTDKVFAPLLGRVMFLMSANADVD